MTIITMCGVPDADYIIYINDIECYRGKFYSDVVELYMKEKVSHYNLDFELDLKDSLIVHFNTNIFKLRGRYNFYRLEWKSDIKWLK